MQIFNLLTHTHTHTHILCVSARVHIELRLFVNCVREKIEYRTQYD